MMQLPKFIQPTFPNLSQMHTWPQPLKRLILTLATAACLAAYLLLLGGVMAVIFTLVFH